MAETTQNQNRSQSSAQGTQSRSNGQRQRTQAQRSASAKRAAATRQRNQARSSQAQTKGQARTTARQTRSTTRGARNTARGANRTAQRRVKAETTRIEAALTEAQRPVLISVGAWLTARDNVVSAVRPYTSRRTAERELRRLRNRFGVNVRKFERRGRPSATSSSVRSSAPVPRLSASSASVVSPPSAC